MSKAKTPIDDENGITSQLRGETIAYALQSGIANLAANFYEPYVNYRIQKHFSSPSTPTHGNYTQNLAGEFAGDIIGTGALITAEAFFPQQLHTGTRAIRSFIDPLYEYAAHTIFANQKDEPFYEQRIEDWKIFQERNFARSAFMGSAGILGNVAIQKYMLGNPSSTKLIFLGKLASTSLSTALGLTLRFAFPEHLNGIDKWMGKQIAPLMTDQLLENAPTEQKESHVDNLLRQRSQTPPHSVS